MSPGFSRRHEPAFAAACAVLITGILHLLLGDVNLDLGDEGFLWYGVRQTAAGQVPLRDFQSYEPARYYWGAAGSLLFGDGILGLRLSNAILQALGLALGLLAARRIVPHPAWLLPVGVLLAVWMFPRHKAIDAALSLGVVYTAVRLVEAPSLRAHLAAGALVGVAACFGRNHALYAGLAFGLLVLLLHARGREGRLAPKLAAAGGGALLGAAPLLGMLAFVPGFAASFVDSLLFFARAGANLPLPIPWPWRMDLGPMTRDVAAARLALGLGFVLLFAVPAGGLLALIWSRPERIRERAVLIGASAVGLFYAHHAAVRADVFHLAQAIAPALLATLALPRSFPRLARPLPTFAVWGALALLTAAATPHFNRELAACGERDALVRYPVAGDELRLRPGTVASLQRIEWTVGRLVPEESPLFLAPVLAGLYPVLGRTSPVWGLYFVWRATPEEEAALIRSLEGRRIGGALILDVPVDGREELRFRNSHPNVWGYLEREFTRVEDALLPGPYVLFLRRAAPA